MKNCEHCGAKNATRAQFCSMCGEQFWQPDAQASDASPTTRALNSRARVVVDLPPARELRRNPLERAQTVESDQRLSEATSLFFSTVAWSLWNIVAATARWFARLLRPFLHKCAEITRDKFVYAISPAHTWDYHAPPNFLYWALLDALLWRLPFSTVAIVYAALANDARRRGDYQVALTRAESAKNWLFFDFALGVVITVFRKLVFIA